MADHAAIDREKINPSRERQAAEWVALWREHPEKLPELFGNFYKTSQRALFLRRLLLALRVPPSLLAPITLPLDWSGKSGKWQEFVGDYTFWHGVRQAIADKHTWKRLTYGVPVLMYHAFAENGEQASRYVISAQSFIRQLSCLKRLGYQGMSIEEYALCLREKRLPPDRCVIITIDDGYRDNYTVAYSILRRFGFPATIFLVSSSLGEANRWEGERGGVLAGREIMSLDQAHEMLAGGVAFGAHTRTHPFLTSISKDQAWQEIRGSKTDLEQALGVPIKLFSYPHGDYDIDTQVLVEQAGLVGAVTTRLGLNSSGTPATALRRVDIFGTDSIWQFLRKIWFLNDEQ